MGSGVRNKRKRNDVMNKKRVTGILYWQTTATALVCTKEMKSWTLYEEVQAHRVRTTDWPEHDWQYQYGQLAELHLARRRAGIKPCTSLAHNAYQQVPPEERVEL